MVDLDVLERVAVSRQAQLRSGERIAEASASRRAERARSRRRSAACRRLEAERASCVSRKYGSKKRKRDELRARPNEICACSASDWPLPKRFACWICAVAMKFSTLEKPAPTWNVPVGFSLTSTLTFMRVRRAALLGRDVDALEVAERGDAALRVARAGLAEELASRRSPSRGG